MTKAEAVAAAKRFKVPSAPVRNAIEVMNDAHMHERGMLQRVEHPSLGEVVLPNSPLRLHGADRVAPVPSPGLGQHNQDVYGDWLGLGQAGVAALVRDGVI
jgi:crotonobetainyl-CoA:carnitine CoA-transferase CaiB-like acyl-CoA transferase